MTKQERLQQDFERVGQLAALNRGLLEIAFDKQKPPVLYRVTFHCKGVQAKDGRRRAVDRHEVDIFLGPMYPDEAPDFQWRTPIVHPNIRGRGVCAGLIGHWDKDTMPLDKVIVRLWDMARYAVYNVDSVLDPYEAKWARSNSALLPLDTRELVEEPFEIVPEDELPEVIILD